METFLYLTGVGRYLVSALFGFCLGGVLFSYHLPKLLKGVDVCQLSADRNPGAMNAFRCAGVPVGILCLLCDLCKGFFPVFFALRFLDPARPWFALVIAAPALGHAAAPLYRGRSGKAIAAAFGALLGLLPNSLLVFLLAALYIFFSVIWVVNPHERRTVATFVLFTGLSLLSACYTHRWSFAFGASLLSAIVIAKNYRDAKIASRLDTFSKNQQEEPTVSQR